MSEERLLEFENGFVLGLVREGEDFLGIGQVCYQGTPLRCPALPWTIYTESEAGLRFDRFRLAGVEADGREATITFTSQGAWMPRVQAADAMGDARIRSRRVAPATVTFRWRFRAIAEDIWENQWTGLAMQIEVDCPGHPIHWLIEDATWELGGQAAGNTLIQQDVSTVELEQTVAADSALSTIERFRRFGEVNNDPHWSESLPMDMLPRCAGASPLDFQVKDDLAMILFAEAPSLTRARWEKFADEDVIHYIDRPFFPLTESARAPERKLLVYRHGQPLKRHEWRNLWLDAFTDVRRRIHATYGFTLEVPGPLVWAFLWNYALDPMGPEWTGALTDALPQYKRMGYDVFSHGVWKGTSDDPERNGGNICSNYLYEFSEKYGGPAVMKALYDRAHELGIEMWQWFGMEFNAKSPLWKDHPEWVLREANGDPWDGNYGDLQCGRFRSEFGQYMVDAIRKIKDQTGLDGIFWDSYQNLGVTCVDWQAPDKAPQAEEIWRFQAELQRYGLRQQCEVITIFGISNVGMFGFDDGEGHGMGIYRRSWDDFVQGDQAFAYIDGAPCFLSGEPFTPERLSPERYFWLMGHRSVPTIEACPWGPEHKGKAIPVDGPRLPGGDLAEEYAQQNHLYNAAVPHMHRLRLTEGGRYTLWLNENGQPSVIWAFQDAQADCTGPVTDLNTGQTCDAGGTLTLQAGHVYLLGDRKGEAPV